MKNIYPNIYKNSPKNLNKAKNFLKRNGIIAVPTETVYGLAANAYKKSAVKKIFSMALGNTIVPISLPFAIRPGSFMHECCIGNSKSRTN